MPKEIAGCPPRGGGRTAKSKDFGFDADHLIRIFLAADPLQLLIAIETFGFRLPDREPIEGLVDLLTELHFLTEEALTSFLLDMEDRITALTGIFYSEGIPQRAETQQRIYRALNQLEARRKEISLTILSNQKKIQAAAEQTKSNQFPFNLPEFD